MEAVLVGAPGSGSRTVGRALAERHQVRFVDLTGVPGERADTLSGLRRAEEADAGPHLSRVIAADRIVADPAVRAQLYRGRHVIWLDVPTDRLIERLRSAVGRIWVSKGTSLSSSPITWRCTRRTTSRAGGWTHPARSRRQSRRSSPCLPNPPMSARWFCERRPTTASIELGTGILGSSLRYVLRGLCARRCVVVTTAGSRRRAEMAAQYVRSGTGLPIDVVELPEGDRSKLLEQQEELFRTLAHLRIERRDPMVAVGDDVLLEAATFSAAVYLRGLPLVTIPVTTLGLIDTSIGGKGGVDLPGVGRNLLGAIHQPKATILDIDLVQDEPGGERRAAMAEVIKYGLIGDTVLLSLLEAGVRSDAGKLWLGPTELLEIVERCALAKRRLVLSDERDTNDVRIALNLGHTVSNALQAATGYRIRHGEAVAYGLRAALNIGVELGCHANSDCQPRGSAATSARSWPGTPRRLDPGRPGLHRLRQEAPAKKAAMGPRGFGRRDDPRRRPRCHRARCGRRGSRWGSSTSPDAGREAPS